MYHILCTQSSTEGPFSSFHVWATVNDAAVNVGVHMSLQINVFKSVRQIPRRVVPASYGNSILNFLRSPHTLPFYCYNNCASLRTANTFQWIWIPHLFLFYFIFRLQFPFIIMWHWLQVQSIVVRQSHTWQREAPDAPAPMWHHTQLSQCCWLYSLHCALHPWDCTVTASLYFLVPSPLLPSLNLNLEMCSFGKRLETRCNKIILKNIAIKQHIITEKVTFRK